MASAPTPAQQDVALGPYLRALLSHKLLVAFCTLAALGGCIAWQTLRDPAYEATAEILVTPLPDGDTTFQGLQFLRDYGEASRTIQTAAALVHSPAAAARAAARLGSGLTREDVENRVVVEPQGESSVLSVTATAPDAEEAAALANAFAEAALAVRRQALRRQVSATVDRLSSRLRELQTQGDRASAADIVQRLTALEAVEDGNDPTLFISEPAAVPSSPTGLPLPVLALLAAIAGFIVGTVLALLLELSDRRVRDEEETLDLVPAPVLARVPVIGRRTRNRGSPTQMTPAVREAFRTLRVRLEQGAGRHRTIMLTSASSGDGKTTSSINLALSLVGAGHRVLLVDFDLRKPDIGRTLGIPADRGLAATLAGTPLADLVVSAPDLPLLRIVSAASMEGDVALLESLRRRLPKLLDEARELADFVVIDSSPLGEVSDALALADEVDDLLVVVRPGHTNRANLETLGELLSGSGHEPTGLVLIGERDGASNTYYTYGHGSRPGVLGRLRR